MNARGLELTLAAVQVHLAAMPWPRYELRLIDAHRRQCVATRYWTAAQLLDRDTVGFLRARNQPAAMYISVPMPRPRTPAICCWTSMTARVRWRRCEWPATRLVWLSKPALAINRLGCA
jgi:hypothetical protein